MTSWGLKTLEEHDPEMADIIEKEKARQFRGLEMIASENFTSKAVLQCLGSPLTNKYSEGEIGARYYGGNEYIDQVETLAKQRALKAFNLDPAEWGVNVQPYSGSPANFAVYTALIKPHDRIMGLDLPSGGHLTHGFYTPKKKISATSLFFESMPYHTTPEGIIDYEEMERTARVYRPQVIVMGASAYPRDYDFPRVRKLCDEVGAILFTDMAHSAGLIAAGLMNSPFETSDVVTTTVHKSLVGPRSGMIFFRKTKNGKDTGYETKINQTVFPGLQGGPHNHQIAAVATQMKVVASEDFKVYSKQVISNMKALAASLVEKDYTLLTGGTENHLLLWNLHPAKVSGSRAEKILESVSISCNKNTVPGDKSALSPGGIRLGAGALTMRGMKEQDMQTVAGFLDRAIKLAQEIGAELPEGAKLKDFNAAVDSSAKVAAIKADVEAFATQFVMPGFETDNLKYKDGLPKEH